MFKILLAALFLISCSTVKEKNEVQLENEFMPHESIIAQMTAVQKSGLVEEKLSKEDMEREAQLIPMNEFIDSTELKKLQKKKEKRIEEKTLMELFDIESDNKTTNKEVDLRYRDTTVKRQWNGTCSAFALVAVMENFLQGKVELSERDMWAKYRKYSCKTAIATSKKYKICPEKYWPQNKVNPLSNCKPNRRTRVKKYTYIGEDIKRAVASLDEGKPVYMGMQTPKDMLSCKKVIRANTRFSNGGHALAIVGYRKADIIGGGYFIIKNSWGSKCGDNGYQYVPFHLADRRDGYMVMWTVEEIEDEIGGNPDPTPAKWKYVCYRSWKRLWFKKCYWKKVK